MNGRRADAHRARLPAQADEIGVCNLTLDRPLPFDPYSENRDMGGFVLIDRSTNSTVGAGMLHFELRRSQNVHWQALEIDKGAHSTLKGHRPAIVWFTGLSGSGKSSIANLVEKKLHSLGVHTSMLDGDNVRHGLSKDLGFTEPDRVENIRRVSEVAGLMVQAGLVVLVSFISPIATSGARRGSGWGRTSSARSSSTRRSRSPRSVTSKASTRRPVAATCASNFTGIDAPYEAPENPEVRIDTGIVDEAAAADLVVAELREMGVLDEDG